MPTTTIELPREMVDAASSYAERGRMSVPLSEFVGCIGGSRRTDDVVAEMRRYDQW